MIKLSFMELSPLSVFKAACRPPFFHLPPERPDLEGAR